MGWPRLLVDLHELVYEFLFLVLSAPIFPDCLFDALLHIKVVGYESAHANAEGDADYVGDDGVEDKPMQRGD